MYSTKLIKLKFYMDFNIIWHVLMVEISCKNIELSLVLLKYIFMYSKYYGIDFMMLKKLYIIIIISIDFDGNINGNVGM